MAMQSSNQQPQVIVHVHKHESPWLRRFVLFWLFGLWYPLFVAVKWSIVTTWKLLVAYPWKWTIALTRWSIKWSIAGVRLAWPTVQRVSVATYAAARQSSQAFYTRYGMRGVAIAGGSVAGVIVLVAVLGLVFNH
ncbi:MAG: hypothetical protein ACXWQR_20490 [Ktedonobacterales bacterium]